MFMNLSLFIFMCFAGIQYTVHGVRGDSDRYWQSKDLSWNLAHKRTLRVQISEYPGHQSYNRLNVTVNCGDGRVLSVYNQKVICGLSYVDYIQSGETLKFHFTEKNHTIPSGDCSGREFIESVSLTQICRVRTTSSSEMQERSPREESDVEPQAGVAEQ